MQPYKAKAPEDKSWNSLEKTKIGVDIAKTIASAVLTVFVVLLGNRFTNSIHKDDVLQKVRDREAAQYAELVKQRRVLWDTIGPEVFDVYCYFMHYDNWREFSEEDIIAKKRKLDKAIYANRPFLTATLFQQYNGLMGACFSRTEKVGVDLLLRTKPDHPRDSHPARFTNEDNRHIIERGYYQFQKIASYDLNTNFGNLRTELQPLSNRPD